MYLLTLRCTRSVRNRLCLADPIPEPPSSTGVLGDWYVNLVRFGRDPGTAIMREIAGMEPVSFGLATNRRVLGSMLDE